MKTVVAIRHVHFEDLGLLAPILEARGYAIRYMDGWDIDSDAALKADLLVLLGGPISVNETREYPFVETEIALAKARLEANRPLLGICLGAQVMTRAMGGTVAPGTEKEIGWAPLALSEAGRSSVLRHLDGVPVLHWHGEVCVPPEGVEPLASTAPCRFQAFAPNARTLALQFHVEAGANGIEPWLVGHTLEIMSNRRDVVTLRQDTARHGPALAKAATAMIAEWLDGLGM